MIHGGIQVPFTSMVAPHHARSCSDLSRPWNAHAFLDAQLLEGSHTGMTRYSYSSSFEKTTLSLRMQSKPATSFWPIRSPWHCFQGLEHSLGRWEEGEYHIYGPALSLLFKRALNARESGMWCHPHQLIIAGQEQITKIEVESPFPVSLPLSNQSTTVVSSTQCFSK